MTEEEEYQLNEERTCLIKMVKSASILLKDNILWKTVYNVYSEDIEELKEIE